jgi:cell wall-associated NlpC family hydrolase
MTEDEERARVLEVAETWVGTPFHDVAGVKGVGVDCAHLLARVFEEAELVEKRDIKKYSPQFFLHRSDEEFLETVLSHDCREITEGDVKPGDVILYKVGRCYAHGAIVANYPIDIIHAHKGSGRVVHSHVEHAEFANRPKRFFSLWPRPQIKLPL